MAKKESAFADPANRKILSSQQLYHAQQQIDEQKQSGNGWTLLAQDGALRLYSSILEIDGLVCDPLKAVHVVKGVTGYEVCHKFFSPETHLDWDSTLESMNVVASINDDTLILHQIHKRIWPAAQRDALFWSYITQVEDGRASCLSSEDVSPQNNPNLKFLNVWIVTNNSTDKPDIPLNGCVRVRLTVSMVCETYVDINADLNNLTRDNLTCKIIYIATINPGGWAPSVLLRQVYKREFFHFLTTFSQYVKKSATPDAIKFGTSNGIINHQQ